MKINRTLSGIVLVATLSFSTPAGAFTDEAIKLVREWILKNGEAIARGIFATVVGKILGANKSAEDIESYNNLTDSICVAGSEGFSGCTDFVQGGSTVRSCGGAFCGLDPKVALMIEGTCGVLSSRNRLKAAEFETSRCAAAAWGKIDPALIEKLTRGSVKDVGDFKRNVLIGLVKVLEPQIQGVVAVQWTQDQVDTKLREYLANDQLGIIQESVAQMARKAGSIDEMRAAWNNPGDFASEVAAAASRSNVPSETAKQAVAGQKAGSRETVMMKPGAGSPPASPKTQTVSKFGKGAMGSGRGGWQRGEKKQ